eukprot:TRINITY_DN748_c0_g1_i1.p1 TRINITY_DN748_c0_g1~~TRINITY_DN748_c0_g1_i1.p1  ORF type:complete len:413 (+),score=13.14 TRINITY_DN748_c0_g1_i1:55-1293(+)
MPMDYAYQDTHKSVKRRALLFTVNVVIVTIYLVIGGFGMQALESDREDKMRQETTEILREVNLTSEQITRLHDLGVCNFVLHEHREKQWTLSGSIFYSMTVITTIGYGSLAPSTYNGRSFTVVYAILGIGVVAQLLGSCAGILLGIGKGIVQRIFSPEDGPTDIIGVKPDPREVWAQAWEVHVGQKTGSSVACIPLLLEALLGCPIDKDSEVMKYVQSEACQGEDESTLIPVSEICRSMLLWLQTSSCLPRKVSYRFIIAIFAVSGVWVFIWAFAFSAIEGWEYRESLWFCVVTMSTIGFGDFTPSLKLSRALSFVFIIPGLGLSAACLGAIWDVFELNRFWVLQKLVQKGSVSTKFLEAHDINTSLSPTRGRQQDSFLLLGRSAFNRPLLSPLPFELQASYNEKGEPLYRL